MDSQHFRNPTYPSVRPFINEFALQKAAERIEVPDKISIPVDDIRHPGHASIMSDARFITDYKSKCANNVVAPKYGNSMREWLQHNGSALIQLSRKRQADRAGAQYHMHEAVPEAKQYQQCDEFECRFGVNGNRDSIGLQRVELVPELFGTFSQASEYAPTSRTPLTEVFEGGRNTPRGREYVPMGTRPFSPRNRGYGASG